MSEARMDESNSSDSAEVDSSQEDEKDNWWLGAGLFENDSHVGDTEDYTRNNESAKNNEVSACQRLREPCVYDENDYNERKELVVRHMGSMALCRGHRGDLLRNAGAIAGLLSMLVHLKTHLPPAQQDESTMHALDQAVVELAIVSWGAIRDLACGNALNRSAVLDCQVENTNGLELSAMYLQRYDGHSWESLPHPQLRLLSSVVGALRNVSHSSRENCTELHRLGVSTMLERSLCKSDQMPDVNQPWREAAYRASGTLVNMSEKSTDCARQCGNNPTLINILIDASGGRLLHLGLAAILRAAETELPPFDFEDRWSAILIQEDKRKRAAQRREEGRKAAKLRQNQ